MRLLLVCVALCLIVTESQAGERKNDKTPPRPVEDGGRDDANKDRNDKRDKGDKNKPADAAKDKVPPRPAEDGGKNDAKKDKNDKRDKDDKKKPADAAKETRIPPGIAKQGDEKVQKWLNSRGQLKKELDEAYDKNPGKSGGKDARQSRAEELFTALDELGMEPNDAIRLLKGMASSQDKDDAFDTVRNALSEAKKEGRKNDKILSDVQNIVDEAESASAIGESLGKWLRKR